MTFNDLNLSAALRNALDDLGFKTPTTIQNRAFSIIMGGKDVCGIAQTGTGKTFAYLLPLLRQFKFIKEKSPQILIIVPTRELVVQVVEAVKKLTTYMTVEVMGIYGGVNMNPQLEAVKSNKIDVLVATPGRLYDIMLSGNLKIKGLKKVVIDEVDEMLNLGFRAQLKNILDLLPEKRQNLMFSATITEEVEQIIESFFNAPVRIEAAPTGTPLDNINQTKYQVLNFNTKVNLLGYLLEHDPSITKLLVFVASKKMADNLYEKIAQQYPDTIGVIHSNKEQNHRFNTVKQFQEGTFRLIIATDIIARGLDVAEVSHVISFDTPDVPESYMHRIGRTGRADRKGQSILFATEKELGAVAAIEDLMQYAIPEIELPAALPVNTELTEDEKPVVFVKEIQIRVPKVEDRGLAFHPKSAKNSKVQAPKESHASKMMKKYGKPKKRKPKK